MAQARFRWKMKAFRDVRRSAAMQSVLLEQAQKLTDEANADHAATARTPITEGPSFEASVHVGRTRARAIVATATPRAMAHERRSSSLLRVAAK